MNGPLITQLVAKGLLISAITGIPLYAYRKNIRVVSTFFEGAKEGFLLSMRLSPYLMAFLVIVGLFRAAGGFAILTHSTGQLLQSIGVPPDILPLALVRPLSGTASLGVLANISQTHGGQSLIAHTAATIMGSTETTFYVATVYFSAARITRSRHAILCGLIADAVGVLAACWICQWWLR